MRAAWAASKARGPHAIESDRVAFYENLRRFAEL
jgi:hypothetical protein